MVELENSKNSVTELRRKDLFDILKQGYKGDLYTALGRMIDTHILRPSVYEPSGAKVYTPYDILRAACALEINKSGISWPDVAESMSATSIVRFESELVRSSKKWKLILEHTKKIGVDINKYPDLAFIEKE
jgi:hypothetical protein